MHEESLIEGNKPKFWPISKLVPNIITISSICAGFTAIRFAIEVNWKLSILALIIAVFLDGIDGRVARFLNVTSNFGAQLDSLADFINFGVAPSLIYYLWQMNNFPIKGVGWAISVFYTICCAIRLARFNTDLDDDTKPDWSEKFFVGVPSTVAACLMSIPFMLYFEFGNGWYSNLKFLAFYMILIGILMASKIPTFCAKKWAIKREYVSFVLILVAMIVLALIVEPWITISAIGGLYFLSIPFSIIQYLRLQNSNV